MKRETPEQKELRHWKMKAHEHLDRLWKDGIFTRSEVYKMLETVFHREIHISQADIKMCKEIIRKLPIFKNKKIKHHIK